jgi:hypothetical protein
LKSIGAVLALVTIASALVFIAALLIVVGH